MMLTEEDKRWYEVEMARAKYQEEERERKRVERAVERAEMIRRAERSALMWRIFYLFAITASVAWVGWAIVQNYMQASACEETCDSMGHWKDVCFCAEEDGTVILRVPDSR